MTTIELMTLKEAAGRYGLKLATLRHEAKEGRLAVSRLGKAYYTTPADIVAMVEKCRVKPAPTCISTAPGTPTASGTELDQSELDAVLAIRLAPKRSLPNTSRANTGPRPRLHRVSGT